MPTNSYQYFISRINTTPNYLFDLPIELQKIIMLYSLVGKTRVMTKVNGVDLPIWAKKEILKDCVNKKELYASFMESHILTCNLKQRGYLTNFRSPYHLRLRTRNELIENCVANGLCNFKRNMGKTDYIKILMQL